VAEAVADQDVANYLHRLWSDEIIPTLQAPPETNLEDYATALLKRFTNTGIKHQVAQIAMDGSQKLPQRLLGTIEDRLATGAKIDALLLGVAGWIAYTADMRDDDDPMAAVLRGCHTKDCKKTVTNILSQNAVFDGDLAAHIERPLVQIYGDLHTHGATTMIRRVANGWVATS
jgi:fructuronate reductase